MRLFCGRAMAHAGLVAVEWQRAAAEMVGGGGDIERCPSTVGGEDERARGEGSGDTFSGCEHCWMIDTWCACIGVRAGVRA